MGSGNESEILMLRLPYRNDAEIKFTKCSVEFKFLATVLRYCLAMAAGALIDLYEKKYA